MNKLGVWATFAACALFAACEHGQPAPREMPPMGARPTAVEPAPVPAGEPATTESAESGATAGTPTGTEARPTTSPMRHRGDGPIPVAPTDAGTPLPNTTQPAPATGAVNPGPSAMLDNTQRNLHSDDDLHLLPPAQRMPVTTNAPAQPMPALPNVDTEPASVKPDAGIQWDAGAPLPPIPDGGPLPQTRDASVPL